MEIQHTMHRPLARATRTRNGGFTILELIIIVATLAVLFAMSAPSLEGLAPKYRLRSSARELGSHLESTRIAAITRERRMGIRYVLNPIQEQAPPYYQVIPPAPDDDPFQPVNERALHTPIELPTGVRIVQIVLSNGQIVNDGVFDIFFSPTGNTGSHIVVLEGPKELRASLKLNCTTGVLEYIENDEVTWAHYEE